LDRFFLFSNFVSRFAGVLNGIKKKEVNRTHRNDFCRT